MGFKQQTQQSKHSFLTSELAKVNEIIASIQLVIDEVLPQLQQAVGALNLKTANLDNLEGSTNSIAVDVQQNQRQILFIEESLQALEAIVLKTINCS